MLTSCSHDICINSHKNDKMACYVKMAGMQTCSNDKSNATDGLVGFFYPKFIYDMHMFQCLKCHKYTLDRN
jgi:hypothetical protein